MSTTAPAGKPKRVGFYRDYLTPTLHRRFTRAAGITLLACYVDAILIGDASSYFWMFFPFGSTGIRTLLLFISALVIFILRVAQLRIGERTTTSTVNALVQSLSSSSTYQTFAFYLFSAWWFSEVYIWSSSEKAGLQWVIPGGAAERDQLNERPIFLRSNFLMLGLGQSFLHLYNDYGRIKTQPSPTSSYDNASIKSRPAEDILKQEAPARINFASQRALLISASTLVTYVIFLRQIAYSWSLSFARLVWDVPRSSEPSTIPPYHWTTLLKAGSSGIFLMSLWELSNLAFSAYVSQPPVKRERPLTSDSPDPNASLLNGLKSKKNFVKTLSFWELNMISISDEIRRKSIYAEYDRKDGSTWGQILKVCLGVLEDINTRLIDTQTPPPEMTMKGNNNNAVQSLPQLSAPLRIGPVLEASPKASSNRERAESGIEWAAKSIGQSPSNGLSPLRKGLKLVGDKALSQEQRKALRPENIEHATRGIVNDALQSPVGVPFRQTFDRRSKAKVFGSPRSEMELTLFSIDSLARLAVNAIKEDSMGQVSKDIGLIMRTLGNIISRIKTFMAESPIHWTDVKFQSNPGGTRHVKEIDMLLDQLRSALKHIIEAYGTFARDMGLSMEEMRVARLAAGLPAS